MPMSCTDCRHYHYEEDNMDGYVLSAWLECDARPTVANLKQFPFKKTECESFAPKRKN